jgi:transcriptional regulator GlxA family with amidase domain
MWTRRRYQQSVRDERVPCDVDRMNGNQPRNRSTTIGDLNGGAGPHFGEPDAGTLTQFTNTDALHIPNVALNVLHNCNVLIRAIHGLDATTAVANTEYVRSVVVLGYSGVQALDLVGPFEVFTGATIYLASQGRADEGYSVTVVSRGGEPATTLTGLALVAKPLPDPREPVDTLVLPGGIGVDEARRSADTIGWIQIAAEHARRVVSVCTGSFLAAQAGLIDGCVATTHWAFAGQMAREFPSITVDPEPIFVRSSEKVWTAAGVTAGIDLALSLVEDDYGTEAAQTVARWLVLYLRRPGGQTQFAAPVWMPRAKRAPIREVQEAIECEPGGAHSIPELARRAAMSPRHFTRVFTDEVGEAPGAYVERVRTEAARRQLEETDDTVTAIAARCGFGSAETLRRNFVRRLGISPDQYRKTFA